MKKKMSVSIRPVQSRKHGAFTCDACGTLVSGKMLACPCRGDEK